MNLNQSDASFPLLTNLDVLISDLMEQNQNPTLHDYVIAIKQAQDMMIEGNAKKTLQKGKSPLLFSTEYISGLLPVQNITMLQRTLSNIGLTSLPTFYTPQIFTEENYRYIKYQMLADDGLQIRFPN